MKTVTLKDKSFSLSIPSSEIQKVVTRLARDIDNDLKGMNPLFVAILNGSFMFAGDLLKQVETQCEITFVKLSSYSGTSSTENVKKLIGLNDDVHDRNLVILEDIIDTGITMENLLSDLNKRGPASIRIATLLLKPDAFIKDFKIDYVGIEIPNDFIVGYGLDYDGLGRNLADIYKII